MPISFSGFSKADKILIELQTLDWAVPAVRDIGLVVESDLKKYPPKPKRSKYNRTGTLGRGWATEIEIGVFDVKALVGNNVPYGPKVQGADTQAEIHQGVWDNTTQAVVNKNQGVATAIITAEIERVLSGG